MRDIQNSKDTPQFPQEKFWEISQKLELYHGLFNKLWNLGCPRFSNSIPTAAVVFNREGRCIDFLFNYEFYKTLDNNNLFFVICHELLHVFLEHGFRSRLFDKNQANRAMDVVINEMLVSSFGFDRNTILNQKEYCWYDTVFNTPVPKDNSFEYYYDLINRQEKNSGGLGQKIKIGGGAQKTVDSHDGLGEITEEMVDSITNAIDQLAPEEKKDLAKKIENEVEDFLKEQAQDQQKGNGADPGGQQAGTIAGGIVKYVNYVKIIKKRKWETVIKNWVIKAMKDSDKEVEQFVRKNRRLEFLNSIPEDTFIPSDYEVDEQNKEKHKIRLMCILDSSGSTWHLADRFFKAALSIPNDRFIVTMACFDTNFYLLSKDDIARKAIKGGGGTDYTCVTNYYKSLAIKPHKVFTITDGEFFKNVDLNPEDSHRFLWFLTVGGIKHYLPPDSKVYNLKDYE